MHRRARFGLSIALCLSLISPPSARAGEGPTCGGLSATVVGTDGADRLVGTDGPDVIVGLSGDDHIEGGGGNDIICGGVGDDVITGMAGRDVLLGQGGSDSLYGHGGDTEDDTARDVLKGGRGSDWINYFQCEDYSRLCPVPDGGDDVLRGGPGNDRIGACDDGQLAISGGRGKDGAVFCSAVNANLGTGIAEFTSGGELKLKGIEDLFGSAWESDILIGDDGANFIYTGFDGDQRRGVRDEAKGGGGADSFVFGDDDIITGGSGSDRFFGGIPSDMRGFASLDGGDGRDRFLLCYGSTPSQPLDGSDYLISGGSGRDTLKFGLTATVDLSFGTVACADFSAVVKSIENIRGSQQGDTLRGDDSDNRIWGEGGDDVLEGRGGDDLLDGGPGTDDCSTGEQVRKCENDGGR